MSQVNVVVTDPVIFPSEKLAEGKKVVLKDEDGNKWEFTVESVKPNEGSVIIFVRFSDGKKTTLYWIQGRLRLHAPDGSKLQII